MVEILTELLRAGSVEDFEHDLTTIHFDLLPIAVFDGRVISFDPYVLDELRSEAALANTAWVVYQYMLGYDGSSQESHPIRERQCGIP